MLRRASVAMLSRSVLGTIVWLVAFAAMHTARTQDAPLEYAVKATYLHKFAPFVEWPNPARGVPGRRLHRLRGWQRSARQPCSTAR